MYMTLKQLCYLTKKRSHTTNLHRLHFKGTRAMKCQSAVLTASDYLTSCLPTVNNTIRGHSGVALMHHDTNSNRNYLIYQ
jgi:hypothetical protein